MRFKVVIEGLRFKSTEPTIINSAGAAKTYVEVSRRQFGPTRIFDADTGREIEMDELDRLAQSKRLD